MQWPLIHSIMLAPVLVNELDLMMELTEGSVNGRKFVCIMHHLLQDFTFRALLNHLAHGW